MWCAILAVPVCILLVIGHFVLVGEAMDAVQRHNLPKLRAIVAIDPWVVNSRTDIDELDNYSLLEQSVGQRQLEIAAFLISKGANVNRRDWMQDSVLHQAVHNNHTEMVKLLLRRGAKPTGEEWQPMIVSARELGNKELVDVLEQARRDQSQSKRKPQLPD